MKKPLLPALLLSAAVGGAALWHFTRLPLHEKGKKLLEQGDVTGAVELFRRALEEKTWAPPVEREIRNELSRAYLLKGAVDNAEEEFQKTLERFPENAYAHIGMGFLQLAKGFDNFALESFQKAKAADPDDLRASLGLASLYAYRGELPAARKEYDELVARAPENRAIREGSGDVFFGEGLFNEAAAEYERALADLPENSTTRLAAARALLAAGRCDAAEELTRRLVAGSPRASAARLLLADIYRDTGRFADAGPVYQALLSEDQRNVFALLRDAEWQARRDDFETAKRRLDQAAQVMPKPGEAPVSFASLAEIEDFLEVRSYLRQAAVETGLAWSKFYAYQGHYADAEREALRALQLFQKHLAALRWMAELQRIRGDGPKRLEWIRRARGFFPRHALLLSDEAEALLALKKIAEARPPAEEARRSCPTLPRAAAVLAQARLAEGKISEAASAAAEAVALGPRDAQAHLAMALVLRSQKKYAEAETALRRSLELDPYNARAHDERAQVLSLLKKPTDSVIAGREAARLEPTTYPLRKN
ncbi:MAG TPA: tetratricopeptide repeat protein [Elusimicrobiota bacterium]|nr:tetratricopeptide repeat protein [Elusimicrobiota bacterium]